MKERFKPRVKNSALRFWRNHNKRPRSAGKPSLRSSELATSIGWRTTWIKETFRSQRYGNQKSINTDIRGSFKTQVRFPESALSKRVLASASKTARRSVRPKWYGNKKTSDQLEPKCERIRSLSRTTDRFSQYPVGLNSFGRTRSEPESNPSNRRMPLRAEVPLRCIPRTTIPLL